MWGSVQRKGWGGLPEPEELLQFCTDWFSRPRDGEGAPWTHQDKPRRPHPSSSLCCSWREQLPDLLQLELLNIALSYEAREWQTVIPSLLWVAISSAKNIKDGSSHSLQISLFYKSLFVVKRRLLSIPGKEKQWRRQKRRDRSGCSHLFQSEANFAGREMLLAWIWRGGEGRTGTCCCLLWEHMEYLQLIHSSWRSGWRSEFTTQKTAWQGKKGDFSQRSPPEVKNIGTGCGPLWR